MKRILLLLMLFFALFHPLQAEVYYIRAQGNDAHSGLSWSEAFRHLSQAALVMSSGDTIVVAAGDTLLEKCTFTRSGRLWSIEAGDSLTLAPSSRAFVVGNPKLTSADDLLTISGAGVNFSIDNVLLEGDIDHSGALVARNMLLVRDTASVAATRIWLRNGQRGFYAFRASHASLSDAVIEEIGTNGVISYSSHTALSRVTVISPGENGIFSDTNFGNDTLRVEQCEVYDCGQNGFNSTAADVGTVLFSHVVVGSCTGAGITVRGGAHVVMDHVTVDDAVTGLRHAGGGALSLSNSIITGCDTLMSLTNPANDGIAGLLVWGNEVAWGGVAGSFALCEGNPNYIAPWLKDYRPRAAALVRSCAVAATYVGAYEPIFDPTTPWGRPSWSRWPFEASEWGK